MTIQIKASRIYSPQSAATTVGALRAGATASARPPTVIGSSAAPINRPANPAAVVYNNSSLTNPSAWAHPGALVIAGRVEYTGAWVTTVANGGGTVLIYIDAIVWNTIGHYHDLLFNASQFGAAVPKWPGNPNANSTGDLADFRVGGVLQSKLAGVINLAISENPKISGIFLDDVGTRSWFPNFDWTSWSSTDKEAYRAGAIAVVQTARTICDANNLFLMVNGTWTAQSTSGIGDGGYPTRNLHGCSLVDGGYWENHSFDQFGVDYGQSAQWASYASGRKNYMWYVNVGDSATRDQWVAANAAAYASSTPYDGSGAPWTTFTDFHIPHK